MPLGMAFQGAGRCCRSREGIVIKMVNKSENKGWRAAVLVRGGRRTNQNKTENQAGRCPELFWQSGFLDGGAKSQLRERLILSLQRHRTIQAALCYLIFIFFIPIFLSWRVEISTGVKGQGAR